MSRVFVVFLTCLAAVAAKQQKLSVVASEPQPQSSDISAIEFEGDYSIHGGKKHSSAAELISLAHTSALQAKTAVRNQQTAGLQASLGAQTGYARAAIEAAATAQVALVAKQVIVQNLEHQFEHAQNQLQAEQAQYQQTLQAAGAAQNAAQQSQNQLGAASAAFAAVQQSVTQIQRAAAASANAAAAQHQMVQDAEQRLGKLHQQLEEAQAGLLQTQLSAQKAAAAARVAQTNASASAQLAVVNSANNQVDEHDEHDSGYHK